MHPDSRIPAGRFPVFQEDLRTKIVGYEVVEVRQSSRQTGAPPPMRIEVADAEIMLLKERVKCTT